MVTNHISPFAQLLLQIWCVNIACTSQYFFLACLKAEPIYVYTQAEQQHNSKPCSQKQFRPLSLYTIPIGSAYIFALYMYKYFGYRNCAKSNFLLRDIRINWPKVWDCHIVVYTKPVLQVRHVNINLCSLSLYTYIQFWRFAIQERFRDLVFYTFPMKWKLILYFLDISVQYIEGGFIQCVCHYSG